MPAEAAYCIRSKLRCTYLSQRVADAVLRLGSPRDAIRAHNVHTGAWWVDRDTSEGRALVARLTPADATKLVALFAAEGGWIDLVVVPEAEWEEWPADE